MRRFFYILGILAAAVSVLSLVNLVTESGIYDSLYRETMQFAFIVAVAFFLIGRLFSKTRVDSLPGPHEVRVEHTRKHSVLEQMAWVAAIAAAIIALLAYIGSR